MPRNEVCLLHRYEVEELREKGIRPSCTNHRHITQVQARELLAKGDHAAHYDANGDPIPMAEWVEPNQSIAMKTFWDWEFADSQMQRRLRGGPSLKVKQLIDLASRPRRSVRDLDS